MSIKPNNRNKDVFFELGDALNEHRVGIKKALHEIGRENVVHARNLITTGSKTGKVYKIKGSLHQSSAEGQAPASLSGNLEKSISYTVHQFDSVQFGAKQSTLEVSQGAPYSRFLETGTKKMKPRPYLITTVNDKERDSFNALSRAIGRKR